MLTPQHPLDLAAELVVDLFAGGGGASTGIEAALGYPPHIAINHDPEAISLHQANHPQTRHFVSDVFEVDPLAVTQGRPVGLLWASPDCTFHSKARGGKPFRDRNRARRRRGLAGIVTRWAAAVRPRVICMENVEEFQHWGPLRDDGTPCPDRRGKSFARWVARLRNLGYTVDWCELRACDYGAPTIRKRLFMVARCDGMPIVWPDATHGQPGTLPVKAKKLKPWRTAAECIDWSIPAPSIFERTKPLAEATCRRIAKGIMRYVVDSGNPFIVPMTHTGGDRVHPSTEPLRTITTAQRGELALAVPTLVHYNADKRPGDVRASDAREPLKTQTTESRHGLVTAFLAKHYGGVVGQGMQAPTGTVTTVDHHSLVTANLIHLGHGEGKAGGKRFSHGIRNVRDPLNTVTASGAAAGVVTSHLVKLRGTNVGSAATEPVHTISAQGLHHAEVRAFLIKYYSTDQDPALREPLHTITTRDRFGLVTIKGVGYQIVDIGLRMLTPRELFRAQGFPESYAITHGADGHPLTKTAQVRMCGNSVCPPVAQAIVAANHAERQALRRAA